MKAIILAAGRGSRMGELTSNLPKCRTPFRGKELIDWQLDAIRGAGIQDIALVRGYLAHTFKYDLSYFENLDWQTTNMVRSLMTANKWLNTDDCIVSYSDIIYSKDTVSKLLHEEADIVISYDPNWLSLWSLRFDDPLLDAESFRIDQFNTVLDIGRKVTNQNEIQGQFMGLLKFSPSGWKLISDYLMTLDNNTLDTMDMTTLLQRLIHQGVQVKAVAIDDQWLEVDTESDLAIYTSSDQLVSAYLEEVK